MLRNDENQILNIIKYSPPLIVLIVSFIITLLIYLDYKKTLNEEKQEITKVFINEHKKTIKQNIQTAINYTQREFNSTEYHLKKELKKELKNAKAIISSIYKNNKDNKTKSEIVKQIKNALKNVRFNEDRGYIFINKMNGERILHPIFPNKEGENISLKKDSNGEIRFQKVKKIIEEKGKGFTTFYFYNPNEKDIQSRKLAYVEYFEPYDWMIGTGEYIDEFEKSIQKRVLHHLSDIELGKKNHYLVMDYEGNFIMNSNKNELLKPSPLITGLKKLLKNGEGFYEFAHKSNSVEKNIYFFKTFPRWKWIILTSFYEKDVTSLIEYKKNYLEEKYSNYLNTIIITSLILTIIFLLISFYLSKILEKKFQQYKRKLQEESTINTIQKNKLQKAQEVAKIGDWEFDLKTREALWSQQIFNILEIKESPKKINHAYLKEIMHPNDWKIFLCSFEKTIRNGTEHNCDYRIKGSDNKLRWINCKGHLSKDKNKINGIIQDITENKTLEIEKQQKDEILYQQSKLAAMGEMIGNIAHQWRQPLSTISTASTGVKLQKEMNILRDESFFESMDAINDSAQYLSQTIDDFRYFFSPTNEKSVFKMQELLDKTLNLITAQFTAKDITIVKEIEDIKINSLENELIQVLINILNNARDALLEKEDLEKYIFIKIYEKNSYINIEILDNAGGIKENIIQRIFEPYFTTKHRAQGTGIGLYMSEEIISKHLEGEITVRNKTYDYKNNQYTGANFIISLKN